MGVYEECFPYFGASWEVLSSCSRRVVLTGFLFHSSLNVNLSPNPDGVFALDWAAKNSGTVLCSHVRRIADRFGDVLGLSSRRGPRCNAVGGQDGSGK